MSSKYFSPQQDNTHLCLGRTFWIISRDSFQIIPAIRFPSTACSVQAKVRDLLTLIAYSNNHIHTVAESKEQSAQLQAPLSHRSRSYAELRPSWRLDMGLVSPILGLWRPRCRSCESVPSVWRLDGAVSGPLPRPSLLGSIVRKP